MSHHSAEDSILEPLVNATLYNDENQAHNNILVPVSSTSTLLNSTGSMDLFNYSLLDPSRLSHPSNTFRTNSSSLLSNSSPTDNSNSNGITSSAYHNTGASAVNTQFMSGHPLLNPHLVGQHLINSHHPHSSLVSSSFVSSSLINMSNHLIGASTAHHHHPHQHHHSHPAYALPISSSNSNSNSLASLTSLSHLANGTSANGSLTNPFSSNPKSSSPLPMDLFKFTPSQINCICETLLKSKSFVRLSEFLCLLPQHLFNSAPEMTSNAAAKQSLGTQEMLLRCKAHIAYNNNKFKELYEVLEKNNFSACLHKELQKLWNEAHYKDVQLQRGKSLGAVDKYRLRRKHPFPLSIWDGDPMVYCFKEKSRHELRLSYDKSR